MEEPKMPEPKPSEWTRPYPYFPKTPLTSDMLDRLTPSICLIWGSRTIKVHCRKGPDATPLHYYGYVCTPRWLEKFAKEREERLEFAWRSDDKRAEEVLRKAVNQKFMIALDYIVANTSVDDYEGFTLDKKDRVGYVLVIGDNESEKNIQEALNSPSIAKLKEVLGVEEDPRWYRA